MEHIAIDLGGRESQVCIRDEKAEIVLERPILTRSIPGLLRKRPRSRVVMETTAEAFSVADAAIALGHEVRVVPATLVRQLGVGARGIKTDVRDARVLSEVSVRLDLPSVHVPAVSSREGKAMCNARDTLIRARTMMINAVRGFLRTQTVRVTSGTAKTFRARVAKALNATDADAKAAQQGDDQKFPSGLSAAGAIPVFVDRMLVMIEQLNAQIMAADEELQKRVEKDPLCNRLMTIPGVGPVCATRFVTTIDDVKRFPSADELQSYLGLAPGEHQSGDKQRRTSTIKCGATAARWALIQSAWCLYRLRKQDPMVVWAIEIEKRRGRKIAITALARKLAVVMYAMWRDGTTYEPSAEHRQNSKRKEPVGMR